MIVGEPIYLACIIPIVAALYLLPLGRVRQLFILAVSYAYYLTFPTVFFVLLLLITSIGYVGALLLKRALKRTDAGWLLAVLIGILFAPLVFYKYVLPLMASGPHAAGASWQLTMAQVVLPIGLSFYTFAAAGYLIDVYLGVVQVERDPFRIALFTGFFPYVTAGPIPRAPDILPQLELCDHFDPERAMQGVREILLGVVMKFWIADSLAVPSATVYANLQGALPLEKLVATLFFAFQLYTDFAGYSLIAIGSARLLSVDLPDNFRQPYLSQSLGEFWRRWHISLVKWLRDYIFTPLSMHWRRHRRIATPAAMMLTLTLVGIWHGTGWGFLAFGVLHGVLLAIGHTTQPLRRRFIGATRLPHFIVSAFRVVGTFTTVSLSLILIRAQTLSQALSIYQAIFSAALLRNFQHFLIGAPDQFTYIHLQDNVTNVLLIMAVIIGDFLARANIRLSNLPFWAQGTIFATSILTVLYQLIAAGAPRLFVYFQF